MNSCVELTCPGCGARVSIGQNECEYCHKPIVITTFNSVYEMDASTVNKYLDSYKDVLNFEPESNVANKTVAMCYLKQRLYEKAYEYFEKAIKDNFDDSEVYFYCALCLLNGNKAFLLPREVIDKIVKYIESANRIEPKGIYYYTLAYVKYDYFERKYLNTTPNYKQCLEMANHIGVSDYDKKMVFDIINVDKPSILG